MKAYVVWVERNLAKVFRMEVGGLWQKVLHRNEIRHHTSRDPQHLRDGTKFFHRITDYLRDATEILIIGPGLAKEQFRNHLERHHHSPLAINVVGSAKIDIVTDAQILAFARRLFRQYDIFGKEAPALVEARR
jgi:stalled ribosome rescue protein Dom34